MACAHPIPIFDKSTHELICHAPCGRCINCLVDKRNFIEDCGKEELYQNNYQASYVTLTYDDYHLDWRDDWHGHLVPSLSKRDCSNFIKRLRQNIARKKLASPFVNPNFRYLVAGEYGDDKKRPHLHFVFFGLSYLACDKLFRDSWPCGQIKLLPVKNGVFRYLASYLDKQVHELNAHDTYNTHNLERPFVHHSTNFGKSLFMRQLDFIKENDWCYNVGKNKKRPLPPYYMKKYRLSHSDDYTKQKKSEYKSLMPNKPFSLKIYNEYKHTLALQRENNLIYALRSRGEPVDDSYLHECSGLLPVAPDVREYVAALKDYNKQQLVTNQDVLDNYDKFEAEAIASNFRPSSLRRMAWKYIHNDLANVPF